MVEYELVTYLRHSIKNQKRNLPAGFEGPSTIDSLDQQNI